MAAESGTKPGVNKNSLLTKRTHPVMCRRCMKLVDVSGIELFSTVHCPGCGEPVVASVDLNHFQLVGVLGKGAMGEVYRAVDQTLQRSVAIKVIRPVRGEDAKAADQCIEEARALASLNHSNVVQIYSVEQADDQPYIVMELIDGDRLDRVIDHQAPLDESRALEITIDVARGLQAACGVGLIHGDVKPANILLDGQAVVKLVDFGIARSMGSDDLVAGTWGTPRYVAPEVVLHRSIDHRADQFSLGVTLYHMLSGRPPFDGPTVRDVIRSRVESPLEDIRRVRTGLHSETALVVSRMLQVDPTLRFESHDELLVALEDALEAARNGQPGPNLFELDDAIQASRPVRRRRIFKAKTSRRPVVLMIGVMLVLGSWVGRTFWLNAQQKATLVLPDGQDEPARWISLLGLVDVNRDPVGGDWTQSAGGVTVSASETGQLAVPFEIDGSYEARIRLTHHSGSGSVGVVVPVASHSTVLVLGARGGPIGGLQWIDGQASDDNGTVVAANALETGKPTTLAIRVTIRDKQASIQASVQDRPWVRWSGTWSSLAVKPPWAGVGPQTLGLGATASEVAFHRVEVRRLRPELKENDQNILSPSRQERQE